VSTKVAKNKTAYQQCHYVGCGYCSVKGCHRNHIVQSGVHRILIFKSVEGNLSFRKRGWCYRQLFEPQSSSASRFIAGAAGCSESRAQRRRRRTMGRRRPACAGAKLEPFEQRHLASTQIASDFGLHARMAESSNIEAVVRRTLGEATGLAARWLVREYAANHGDGRA